MFPSLARVSTSAAAAATAGTSATVGVSVTRTASYCTTTSASTSASLSHCATAGTRTVRLTSRITSVDRRSFASSTHSKSIRAASKSLSRAQAQMDSKLDWIRSEIKASQSGIIFNQTLLYLCGIIIGCCFWFRTDRAVHRIDLNQDCMGRKIDQLEADLRSRR